MSRRRPCFLCNAEDQETKVLIVRWRDPQPGNPPTVFTAGPRCVDRVGCRRRVEASIDPITKQRGVWEVIDAGEGPASENLSASGAPLGTSSRVKVLGTEPQPDDLEQVFR